MTLQTQLHVKSNSIQAEALTQLLATQRQHILTLQEAITNNQNDGAGSPLSPDLRACNGQAHGDPHSN